MQLVVPGTGIDGAKGGEEPAPGVVMPLQDLLPRLISPLLELGTQGGGGIMLIVQGIPQEEQTTLLGAEQKDQPHHDRNPGLVQLRLGDAPQEAAAAVLIGAIDGAHQDGQCFAYLQAQLVGDLLLIGGGARQEVTQGLPLTGAHQAHDAQQGPEGLQGEGLSEP